MGKRGWILIGLIFAIVLLLGGYVFFVRTGGGGLARVAWHYFLRDIPDKKYSWQDFTERGEGQGISGFYAYGDQNGFSMWTLSGLKTFTHVPGVSVYQHEDICFALAQIEANTQSGDKTAKADQTFTGKIEVWQNLVQRENLVTVLRLPREEYRHVIDKVWSYSGRYKVLNKLDQGVCE